MPSSTTKTKLRKTQPASASRPKLRKTPPVRASFLSASERTALLTIIRRHPQARYEGASWNPSRSWLPASVQSARFDASSCTRLELTRKSRYFEKNSAVINRCADLFECYVAGSGIQLNPASSDEKWNANAKLAWDGWSPLCDLTSRQSFATLVGLMARTWFVDGEVFILLTRGESGRPRIQLVEGHLVATPPNLADQEGKTLVDGVAIDSKGRPTGYWIAEEDSARSRTYRFVSADFVVHLFEPSRPGQYRGLPLCYPTVNDIHDLDDLQILEMKAARDAADVTNVVKSRTAELDDETLLRTANQISQEDTGGNTTTQNRGDYVRQALGGRTVALFPDEDLQQFATKRPAVTTQWYWRFLAEKVCTGIGIPYVLVFPDSMQGTVYRGALDMANSFFKSRFETLATAARRVYEYVMGFEVITNPVLRDPPGNWRNVTIHPPRSVNVDVGRNSSAMLAELKAGTRTFAGIYAELGLDWRQQLRQRATEVAYIHALAAEYEVEPAEISELAVQEITEPEEEPMPPPPAPEPQPLIE